MTSEGAACERVSLAHAAAAIWSRLRIPHKQLLQEQRPGILEADKQERKALSGCIWRLPQVPQPAALFHNDCHHVAAQLLSLPYLFAPALAQLAPSAPSHFIDSALRLRAAGTAVLDAQVRILQWPLCLGPARIRPLLPARQC